MRSEVARGPGPLWLRWLLVLGAVLYFIGLLVFSPGWKSVPQRSSVKPIAFFLEAAGLFPNAALISFEFRLEGWSCGRRRWERVDPRPYFPIEADNKESRFHRAVEFFHYKESPAVERIVMTALDDYIVAHHGDVADGFDGPIGGIRVYEVWRDLPPPGDDTARYAYRPLAPLAPGEHVKRASMLDKTDVNKNQRKFYMTDRELRATRCKAEKADKDAPVP